MKSTGSLAPRQPLLLQERAQREHELSRAYAAAKTLEERLELASLDEYAAVVRRIRWRIAGLYPANASDEMHAGKDRNEIPEVLADDPPGDDVTSESTASPRSADGSSS